MLNKSSDCPSHLEKSRSWLTSRQPSIASLLWTRGKRPYSPIATRNPHNSEIVATQHAFVPIKTSWCLVRTRERPHNHLLPRHFTSWNSDCSTPWTVCVASLLCRIIACVTIHSPTRIPCGPAIWVGECFHSFVIDLASPPLAPLSLTFILSTQSQGFVTLSYSLYNISH
jgi:hypothetical protein